MGTQKYIEEEIKPTQRELQAAPCAPPCIDETASLSNVARTTSACVIDFFEERDRVRAGLEESSREFEIDWRVRKVATRRLPSIQRVDRLEESLYWLFSAATLIYLLLGILGR